tara:strand:+ start:251 stop:649 length:399 start_codon:yes stop_codon:yes gene_type:complete
MFGPNDFRPSKSSGKMLGGIPALNAQQELAWARASRKAKDYIDKAKRDGKNLVKRTPDGSMNNILGGISGIASGISGLGGLGLFGGGGDGFGAADILTNPNINYDAGIGPGGFGFDFKSNPMDWSNPTPFSW